MTEHPSEHNSKNLPDRRRSTEVTNHPTAKALPESRPTHLPRPSPPKAEGNVKPQSLWYYKEIDLLNLFPISRLYAIRKIAVSLFAAILFWSAYFAMYKFEMLPQRALVLQPYLIGLTLFALFSNWLNHELFRLSYDVKIDGFRLFISRGFFIREQGSLPILPISEIYIRRSFLDMLFGLSNVQLLTALDKSERFACIEGLPVRRARALTQFLSDELGKQVALAEIPRVNKETGEETPFRQYYLSEDKKSRSFR